MSRTVENAWRTDTRIGIKFRQTQNPSTELRMWLDARIENVDVHTQTEIIVAVDVVVDSRDEIYAIQVVIRGCTGP